MKHKISQEEKFQMMTTAPIPSLIGKMAVPTIISMLITSIYNIADTFFVSRLGTSATASVGIVFPVMAIIQALGFFFGHGSGNSISRRLGAKDTERAEQLAGIGFFSAFLCGLCVTVLGLLFLEPLSLLLGSTSTILPYTKDYFAGCALYDGTACSKQSAALSGKCLLRHDWYYLRWNFKYFSGPPFYF